MTRRPARRRAPKKPIDYMTPDEMADFAEDLLADVRRTAAQLRHGRWRRSKYTDAICNAGPGWKPGMPLVGRNGQTLSL